jgi:hypothetical protein
MHIYVYIKRYIDTYLYGGNTCGSIIHPLILKPAERHRGLIFAWNTKNSFGKISLQIRISLDIWIRRMFGVSPPYVLKFNTLLFGERVDPSLQACLFQNNCHNMVITYTVNLSLKHVIFFNTYGGKKKISSEPYRKSERFYHIFSKILLKGRRSGRMEYVSLKRSLQIPAFSFIYSVVSCLIIFRIKWMTYDVMIVVGGSM